jgi:hypothetical protein
MRWKLSSLVALCLLVSACDAKSPTAAAFSCPATGTVFVMSMPLALSPDPQFHDRVTILGGDGFDCHIQSQAFGDYWLHAGIIDSNRDLEWRAAAEDLWPLKVGNQSHAYFHNRGVLWNVDYSVVDFERFEARAGNFDAYKIVGHLRQNGKLIWTATIWWSPLLRYTLSYHLERTDNNDDRYYEIGRIGSGEL